MTTKEEVVTTLQLRRPLDCGIEPRTISLSSFCLPQQQQSEVHPPTTTLAAPIAEDLQTEEEDEPNSSFRSPIITRVSIGRGVKANVFLFAAEHPSFVSREHAVLEYHHDSLHWTLADQSSVNGVFVMKPHNHRIKQLRTSMADQPVVLSSGDRIFFGNPQHSFFVEYEFCQETKTVGLPPLSFPGIDHDLIMVDVWRFRIFPYLDLDALRQCSQTCTLWRNLVHEHFSNMRSIQWRNEWSSTKLVSFLHLQPESLPCALHLGGCLFIRDQVLEQVSTVLQHRLMKLDLSGSPAVSARGLALISSQCTELTSLLLRGCKRIGFPSWNWIVSFPKLEEIDLRCTGCTNLAITMLCHASPLLTRIDVGFMNSSDFRNVGISNASLVAMESLRLHSVDLRGCRQVTDEGLCRFVQNQPALTSLVLHSSKVTDDTLRVLSVRCPHLLHLDIHRCVNISDQGIGHLNALRMLRVVDFSSLSITDEALVTLECNRLESLDLRSCKHISGRGLLSVVRKNALTLKRLDVNGCPLVRFQDVVAMSQISPLKLTVLEVGMAANEDSDLRWTTEEVDQISTFFPPLVVQPTFSF